MVQMHEVLRSWHSEHAYFTRLLGLLQHEVERFHDDAGPDYQLMLDIIDYLHEYAGRYHHPREDEAFKRLVQLCPDRALPVARLKQEHRSIDHAGQQLRLLLQQAVQDTVIPRAEVEVAAAFYLVYYGNHIAKEEEDLLPRAGRELGAADWEAVAHAVPAGPDPLFGPRPQQRFQQLRRRIAAAALHEVPG
jgi:hemerythrin-like domain-containing protein